MIIFLKKVQKSKRQKKKAKLTGCFLFENKLTRLVVVQGEHRKKGVGGVSVFGWWVGSQRCLPWPPASVLLYHA